jgi:cytochrome c553
MKNSPFSFWRGISAASLMAAALAACGGGSGGGDATPASRATPVVTLPGAATPVQADPISTTPTVPGAPAVVTPAATFLTLPLEVLGNGSPRTPVIAEAGLGVAAEKLQTVTRLWFQCHRCGFYSAPEFEAATYLPVKIKASVRVLGGVTDAGAASVPWIDVTDATVTLADDERLHGGVNGGLYTTRITLALDAATRARLVALPAYNRVQFRFNGTDGESNGYRILNVQLQDAGAVDAGTNTIQRFDPASERGVAGIAAADVDAGKALWYAQARIAKSSIVPRTLQAACASCHAATGRDLQYFNYSNNAIVQRSRFHGLSSTQGQQIVAYLRSSLASVPYVEKARPWNPPYQPGPNLDCAPSTACAAAWSAGAGLDAVLSSPADALKALFGKSVAQPLALTQGDVDAMMNATATMNAREIPVPIQFPDWNAWLPTIHPLDVWPTRADGSGFVNGAAFAGDGKKIPNRKYLELITWLQANKNPNGNMADWRHLTPSQRAQIMDMFYIAGWEGYNFLGGGRGNHTSANGQSGAVVGGACLQALAAAGTTAAGAPQAFTSNAFIERAVASMLHWNSVKQWELAQDFALEGNQQWFIGAKDPATGAWKGRGEAHGWPFNSVSAFFLAPHMIYQTDTDANGKVTREWVNAWETGNVVASYYRSNQWYQLQMSLNPGGQSGWVNYPMDWPYLTAFDDYIAQKVGDATPAARAAQNAHYVRLLQARIKSAQYVNNDIPLYDPNEPILFNNQGRYGRGQVAKHLTTTNFLDNANRDGVNKTRFAFLDDVQAGMYMKVVNGSIAQFNSLYVTQPLANWRRCDPANTQLGEPENVAGFRYCLDTVKTPLGTYADGTRFMTSNALYQVTTEQTEQYGVWKATQLGAEPARLKIWRDWVAAAWP